MPTIIQPKQGHVTGIWGTAFRRDAHGHMQPLKVGDLVHAGDVLLTSQNGIVQITEDGAAPPAAVASAPQSDADTIINALNQPDSQAATAAGLTGGDGAGDLSPGLRVDRIAEATTPAGLVLPSFLEPTRYEPVAGSIPPRPQIGVTSETIDAAEGGPAVNLNLGTPTNTTPAAVITVTQIPLIGTLEKGDGTPVTVGTVLTTNDLTHLKYVPPASYDGTSPVGQFTYHVSDGSATADGTVNIKVDDAPTAVPDTASTPENTPVSGNVLANDHDVDSPTLTVTQYTVGGVTHAAGSTTTLAGVGTIVVNADGSFTFTPVTNYTGAVPTVGYTVSDGTLSSSSTLDITVTATPHPPVVVNDSGSGPEGSVQTGNVLANDSDPDGHALTVTQFSVGGTTYAAGTTATLAGVGTVTIDAHGNYTFTPAGNYSGTVPSIGYTANDGTLSGSATLSLTVTPVIHPPIATPDTASTPINTPLTNVAVLANDSDPDGYTLHVSSATLANPAQGTVTINPDGTLNFTPAANITGPVVINYGIDDGHGGTATSTLTVTVGQNHAPSGADETVTIDQDTSKTFSTADFGYTDPDAGQSLAAVRIDTLPGAGTLTLNGVAVTAGQVIAAADLGHLVFTPVAHASGSNYAAFTFSVEDSAGAFDATPNTVTLNVTPVIHPPVATPDAASTPINTPLTNVAVLANDSDPDGYALHVSSATLANPAQGTVTINPDGTLNFTPAANVTGTVVINYGIDDGHGGTAASTLTVTVGPNHAPAGADETVTIAQDTTKTFSTADFGYTDPDAGQSLAAVRIDTLPGAGTLTLNGVAVTAGQVIAAADLGHLVFTPVAHASGSNYAAFTFSVEDSAGTFDATPNTITLNVTPVIHPPIAGDDVTSVVAGSTVIASAADGVILSGSNPAGRDTDPDGYTLTVIDAGAGTATPTTAVTAGGTTIAGTYGELVLKSDGSYTYTADHAGTVAAGTTVNDVFTYQVSDGHGGTATATLTVHVSGGDTIVAPPPSVTPMISTLGLNADYYGYNDYVPTGSDANRRHSDDGTVGNLDSVADFNTLVNLRNAAVGGSADILGSATAANTNAPDASFLANYIDYGEWPHQVANNLGTNINVAPGGSTAVLNDADSSLYRFLDHAGSSDPSSIVVHTGTGDGTNGGIGPTSGLGTTSDAGIRFTGEVYMPAGVYDIRITGDDGYRLELNGQTVAMADDIQSATTRDYTGVAITGGMTSLELLYWEQGENANLTIQYKLSGTPVSDYQVLSTQTVAMFSEANAPTLTDNQHIVAGSTPGTWVIETGSTVTGGTGNDNITDPYGGNTLVGGAGNDTLNGSAGNDILIGGKGDDVMTGTGTSTVGGDTFRWQSGDGGTTGTPAHDTINNFNNANYSGDVLDLRDLLVGENHAFNTVSGGDSLAYNVPVTVNADPGNLASYLHFTTSGGNTVIDVSTTGGFANGYNAGAVDQVITLTNVNLVGGMTTDNAIITDLFKRGKLVTDGH